MKSPFPGMDPYLEARWSDVHAKLIAFIAEALQPALPTDLRARSDEDVPRNERTAYRSDVAVVHARPAAREPAGAAATLTVEPVILEIDDSLPADRFVQIIDTSSGNRVVTVIEVLSPWNKASGILNERYLKKLSDYRRARVNIVEIDLLREPSRRRMEFAQDHLPADRREPYLASVYRDARADRWEIYPLSLRRPLPPIPIPLRQTDSDVLLELQPLIERVYVAGGHDDIDYRKPPRPELHGEDAAWADELLRGAGRR